MRIRNLFLGIFLLLILVPLDAQFKYGIRGGINSSNISLFNEDLTFESAIDARVDDKYIIEYSKGSLGFHLGGLVQYYISDFFIQPELLFSTVKNDIQITHETWTPDSLFGHYEQKTSRGLQKFNKINMPVLLGYRLGPLRLHAGPIASIMLSTSFEELDGFSINQTFVTTTFGYQVGIGVELASLNIDVKYEGPLSKLGDEVTVNGRSFAFDQRMSQWILSIAFVLGND